MSALVTAGDLSTKPRSVVQAGEVRSARVESLRAVAALAVLVSHVFGGFIIPPGQDNLARRAIASGGFAVYLFFALTGYLLFWPFVRRAVGQAASVDLGRYARNRVLRIVPLYYFVLAVVLAINYGGGRLTQWAHFLTFTQNFSHATINTVNGPMWSLGIEVEFYLTLPLLAVLLATAARGSAARVALGLSLLGALSLVIQILTVQRPDNPSLFWKLSFPATFFYFIAGMLLALLRWSWQEHPPTWLRATAASSDAWLLAAIPVWMATTIDFSLTLVTIPVASFLLIGACVLPLRAGRVTHWLEWRPLAVLGIASYGIYLWNFPIIEWLAGRHLPYSSLRLLVASLIACSAAALATYAVVEAPWLRLRRRWSPATAPTSTQSDSVGAQPAA